MSYVAANPSSYQGSVVGNGQCVAYVQTAASAPVTSQWSEGIKVRGSRVAANTAIAAFTNGRYTNVPGQSHAAIFVRETADGLEVWDQWVGHPVSTRVIRFRGGSGDPVNDGDAFNVIE